MGGEFTNPNQNGIPFHGFDNSQVKRAGPDTCHVSRRSLALALASHRVAFGAQAQPPVAAVAPAVDPAASETRGHDELRAKTGRWESS